MKRLLHLALIFFPWILRRWLLQVLFKYQIHSTARIGYSLVMPEMLIMGPHSRIGHGNVIKGLSILQLDSFSSIANGNWIYAVGKNNSQHYCHLPQRVPSLVLSQHSAITSRHIIDGTESITIGAFATIAGYRSQLLTHSLDIHANRQDAKPIYIGAYNFIGTQTVILGGTHTADYIVIGANSLVKGDLNQPFHLYAGSPAVAKQPLDPNAGYFTRQVGFVF